MARGMPRGISEKTEDYGCKAGQLQVGGQQKRGKTRQRETARERLSTWPTAGDGAGKVATLPLPLHADHLPERVDDLDEVLLGLHHGVDILVGAGRLVDHVLVLPALDPLRGLDVVGDGEPLLGLGARHGPAGAVAAALEALRVALAADDVGAGAHASGEIGR